MTNYPLRYAKRELAEADAWSIFETAEHCVVSTVDSDGMPYGVPLSFVRRGDTLYFHSTNAGGHKLDDFLHDARACATSVVDVEALFNGGFTTRFGSAMAFGSIRRVEDGAEARQALAALCMKYLPAYRREIGGALERDFSKTAVFALKVETLTGKAAFRDAPGA